MKVGDWFVGTDGFSFIEFNKIIGFFQRNNETHVRYIIFHVAKEMCAEMKANTIYGHFQQTTIRDEDVQKAVRFVFGGAW
jgi:hypothetical protein